MIKPESRRLICVDSLILDIIKIEVIKIEILYGISERVPESDCRIGTRIIRYYIPIKKKPHNYNS